MTLQIYSSFIISCKNIYYLIILKSRIRIFDSIFLLSPTTRLVSFSSTAEYKISYTLCAFPFHFISSHDGPIHIFCLPFLKVFLISILSAQRVLQFGVLASWCSFSSPIFPVILLEILHHCLNSTHPFGSCTYHYQCTFISSSYLFSDILLKYTLPQGQ